MTTIEVKYTDYLRDFKKFKTVKNSYNSYKKTIKIILNSKKDEELKLI